MCQFMLLCALRKWDPVSYTADNGVFCLQLRPARAGQPSARTLPRSYADILSVPGLFNYMFVMFRINAHYKSAQDVSISDRNFTITIILLL